MKIGIIFGGRSYEHEISVITAVQASAVLKDHHFIYPIYAKEGKFYLLKGDLSIRRFGEKCVKGKECTFVGGEGKGGILVGRKCISLDCMLMCCHGGEGEDGTFSAIMESCDIPYTSSALLSSAVTMDKRYTKLLCEKAGFPTAKGIYGRRGDDLPERAKSLRFPLIVKPARLGSSIGIDVAHDEEELIEAIGIAFSFDRDVVVEELIEDAIELNCAAFSEGEEIVVSGVENPCSWHEFLTFEEKYEGGKYKSGCDRIVRSALADRVREVSVRVYRAFDLFGIARMDYLYSEKEDVLYLNEINSQPGSLSYYLFEEVGIGFRELLERVIDASIRRRKEKDIIIFNRRVLENLSVFKGK